LSKRTHRSDARHQRGQLAETIAQRLMIKNGMKPILRNYFCKLGEIDLIFYDHGCLVFIEVRARANSNFAFPTDTIDYHKQRKIILTAEYFLLQYPQYANNTCRFDVVGVDFSTHPPHIEWIKEAF
jgi:putative endonuclease